ncbi:hypothetical protein [Mesorhizobium atlanticum]|uniref:hypothetical protein n=1 Tax=Mesorhizobium atlanticum TaxID=2233532 RepID=UPI0011BD694C|nr:hypothetical protein [Mesorhizobium atlanticum]
MSFDIAKLHVPLLSSDSYQEARDKFVSGAPQCAPQPITSFSPHRPVPLAFTGIDECSKWIDERPFVDGNVGVSVTLGGMVGIRVSRIGGG